MVRLKQESTYNKTRHKYKKTSQGKRKLKTSTMNKHKRRRVGLNLNNKWLIMATRKEVAEHLDLSLVSISQLIQKGVLDVKQGRNPMDLDLCRRNYINYLRQLGGYNKRSGSGDIAEEKTRLTKAQADKAELEVSELEAELIPASLVQSTWTDYIANVRAKLLALPSRVAHLVITTDKYVEAEQIIKEQVYESLQELAENGIPTKYRQRNNSNQPDLESTTES